MDHHGRWVTIGWGANQGTYMGLTGCWHWQSLPRGAPSSISLALSSPPTNNLTITPPSNSLSTQLVPQNKTTSFFHLSSLSLGPIRHLPTPSTEAPLSRILFIRFSLNKPSNYYKFHDSRSLAISCCGYLVLLLLFVFVVPFHHPLCRHCPPSSNRNEHAPIIPPWDLRAPSPPRLSDSRPLCTANDKNTLF
ncbi:hypothetical protein DER44DRAFT_275976 [Fusarium oxysporum]|nr:hypothetical protein DER44DRAFT_275976 [Fusarium oxysporum]